jgi:hypothetical protein
VAVAGYITAENWCSIPDPTFIGDTTKCPWLPPPPPVSDQSGHPVHAVVADLVEDDDEGAPYWDGPDIR